MPNPTIRGTTGNGTVTPATATLTGVTASDLLLCVISCVGSTATSIGTPTGDTWVSIQNQAGSGSGVPSLGMFYLVNAGAGSHTPSSVLTGTLTGWVIQVFELTAAAGAGELLISSAVTTNTVAALSNVISTSSGQAQPNELFIYSVVRPGAVTIASPTSGLNNWAPPGYTGASQWSTSQQSLANVQGLSLDTYFGDTNNAWPCPFPQGAGVLSAAANSVQIAAWFNSQATIPSGGGLVTNIGGGANAQIVPTFMQGMIGG